jgi:nucleoside-diphosphate-sugar epimerase
MAHCNSSGSAGWLDGLATDVMDRVDVVLGDVRDAGCVVEFMRDAERVFHLAALIGILYSYRAPQSR